MLPVAEPRKALCLLVIVASAVGLSASATTAHAGCIALDGGTLDIRSYPDDARDRITWKAKDTLGRLLLADPTVAVTTIELVARDRVALTATITPASASGWTSAGLPVKKWKYAASKDPLAPDGVASIKSSAGSLTLKGKGVDLDEIEAPLFEPIVMRLGTSSGQCIEATFKQCTQNGSARILCKETCPLQALPPPVGAHRTIVLDTAQCSPFEDRLRAFNVSIQNIAGVDFETRGLDLLDRMFDPRPGRQVRLEYAASHWPPLGFDGDCAWLGGVEPRLDDLATRFASSGAVVEMRLQGTPAMFSSDCVGNCANRMVPGGACVCGPDFSSQPPVAYTTAWRDHWKCALKHYAALGVRRFEIWNEPDNPIFFTGTEPDFLTLFENLRLALEEARDELDPSVASAIEIGGPANSTVYGAVGAAPGPLLPVLYGDVAVGPGDASLDFASAHAYTRDPGLPFAGGWIDDMRSWVPASWNARLELNEWNVALGGNHACDDADAGTPGLQAPLHGPSIDDSESCDHRGAGYAAYMLPGFVTAGSDVHPYVFETFANGLGERCDMIETGLGLFTKHGLPKPLAAVHWAASQLRGRLLAAQQETLTNRSIGWIAAHDETGTVHVLIGQFDSSARDHFSRSYAAAGHDGTALFADCGCATQSCLEGRFATALGSGDPVATLMGLCPGLNVAEATDALAAAQLALTRVPGTTTTVALDLRHLTCRDTFTVDVFTVGPGQSTAEAWRAEPGPHQFATTCDATLAAAMDAHPYDWVGIQDRLWDVITTPTATYVLAANDPMPLLTVPAYGSLYVRVR